MASVTGGSVQCKMARLADTQTLGAHSLCQVVNSNICMYMEVSFWNPKTLCIKMFASFKRRDCWENSQNYPHMPQYTRWSAHPDMVVISLCSGQSSPFPVPYRHIAGLHGAAFPARLHTRPGHQHHPLPLHLFTAALRWWVSSCVISRVWSDTAFYFWISSIDVDSYNSTKVFANSFFENIVVIMKKWKVSVKFAWTYILSDSGNKSGMDILRTN